MDTTLYYSLLFIHIISLVIGFGAVFVIDAFGFLWLIKKFNIELEFVRKVANVTQQLIWIGFVGLVVTGVPMLVMKDKLTDLTVLKLFLVLMVGLNGIFLHYIKKGLDQLGAIITNVPSRYYFRIGLATFISQLGWWGATLIGFYNRQVGGELNWSNNYLIIIGVVVFLIGLVALIGEVATNSKTQS